MEISFQGIKNIHITRSKHIKQYTGLYPTAHGEVATGDLAVREYKLNLDLTNDSAGKDYDEFLMSMSKAGKGLNVSYFKNNPNKIELHVVEKNVLDDDIFQNYSFSVININGDNINLTNKKGLGLYTYLAKLTRELKDKFNLSDAQKEIVNKINHSIHSEAVRFIEMM